MFMNNELVTAYFKAIPLHFPESRGKPRKTSVCPLTKTGPLRIKIKHEVRQFLIMELMYKISAVAYMGLVKKRK
jgi:hypothetical protein